GLRYADTVTVSLLARGPTHGQPGGLDPARQPVLGLRQFVLVPLLVHVGQHIGHGGGAPPGLPQGAEMLPGRPRMQGAARKLGAEGLGFGVELAVRHGSVSSEEGGPAAAPAYTSS